MLRRRYLLSDRIKYPSHNDAHGEAGGGGGGASQVDGDQGANRINARGTSGNERRCAEDVDNVLWGPRPR